MDKTILGDPLTTVQGVVESGVVKRLGVYAGDLGTGEVLLDYNGDLLFRSASTIKLAIAYEVMRRIDIGEIRLEDEVKLNPRRFVGGSGLIRLINRNIKPTVESMLQFMLTVSDNSASNIMIELVGKSNVNSTMRSLGLKDISLTGKFMQPRRRRFNTATPKDMAKLISIIYKGVGLSAESRRKLVRILSFQQHTGLIPSSLPGWHVKSINKPGALSDLRADVAVVWTKDWSYSLAIYAEGFDDSYAGEECVRRVSRSVFNVVNTKYVKEEGSV
ncbi:MAG: serine hydrolase [Thermoprotei archaeon]